MDLVSSIRWLTPTAPTPGRRLATIFLVVLQVLTARAHKLGDLLLPVSRYLERTSRRLTALLLARPHEMRATDFPARCGCAVRTEGEDFLPQIQGSRRLIFRSR